MEKLQDKSVDFRNREVGNAFFLICETDKLPSLTSEIGDVFDKILRHVNQSNIQNIK